MFPHVRPVFTGSQLSPLSSDRKTPLLGYVPAKIVPLASIASARTSIVITPPLTSTQVSPLSVERKTPPAPLTKSAPAKMSPLALTASDLM